MPSVTKKQKRTMAGACRNPRTMKVKIPRQVACDFHAADKRASKRKKKP